MLKNTLARGPGLCPTNAEEGLPRDEPILPEFRGAEEPEMCVHSKYEVRCAWLEVKLFLALKKINLLMGEIPSTKEYEVAPIPRAGKSNKSKIGEARNRGAQNFSKHCKLVNEIC